MKLGILGAGNIASTMASTVIHMDEVECYAVGAREMKRAQEFADKFGFQKAYGSYEELAADDAIDLIYIATPHSHHYEHVMLCLEHGKNVLCEKAFMVNEKQAREVLELAKSKNLLVTEALWTRYMPSRKMIDDILDSGIIGEATSLTANLGYVLGHIKRMTEPELAGGALLDLSVYPINFALMAFGNDIDQVQGMAAFSKKGVDTKNSVTITWKDGRMAVLHANMLAQTDREGVIFGDRGYIEVQNINNCEEIRVYNLDRKLIKTYKVPEQITGYEYEVQACMRALENGNLECPQMPHKETLLVMNMLDEIRRQWKMTFPCE